LLRKIEKNALCGDTNVEIITNQRLKGWRFSGFLSKSISNTPPLLSPSFYLVFKKPYFDYLPFIEN